MAYATVTQFKDYAHHPNLPLGDALVSDLIDRAQGLVDRYCGRTFEASTDVGLNSSDGWVTRNFDYLKCVDGYTLYFDRDICVIGAVTNGDSDNTIIVSSNYVTNPRNDTPYNSIKLKSSTSDYWTYADDPEDAISVAGVWAYSLTPPPEITHATLRLTNWFYKQREAELDADRPVISQYGFAVLPGALPSDIKSILDPFVRRRVYGVE